MHPCHLFKSIDDSCTSDGASVRKEILTAFMGLLLTVWSLYPYSTRIFRYQFLEIKLYFLGIYMASRCWKPPSAVIKATSVALDIFWWMRNLVVLRSHIEMNGDVLDILGQNYTVGIFQLSRKYLGDHQNYSTTCEPWVLWFSTVSEIKVSLFQDFDISF